MTQRSNVLHVNPVAEQTAYRAAVARILSVIQHETGDTLLEISERIGVSLGTISNAANKKNDLSPTYLKRLGEAYGPERLNPWHALYGARAVPLESLPVADILPFVARVNLKIVEARCPTSPGGTREIHTERKGYLSDLLALQRELAALISDIEAEAA